MTAGAAKNGALFEFFLRPHGGSVAGQSGVTAVAGKPIAAASKLDRDDVVRAMVVSATRFVIDLASANRRAMKVTIHALLCPRGHIKTSTDAIVQQAIMRRKPRSKLPP